jgi:hypothetical protein
MNVIRHDDPRLHSVIAPIGFEQNLFDEFRDARLTQPTRTVTTIQPGFELSAFDRIIRLFQKRLKLRATRDRKRIVKLKRDELREARRIEVRQKSSLMPAAKAFLQFSNGWFPIPLAFCTDESEQANVLRRRATNWFR